MTRHGSDRIRRISALFEKFPDLRDSVMTYSAADGVHRYINSEGTQIRQVQSEGTVQMAAAVQSPDGMMLRDENRSTRLDAMKMPSEEELAKCGARTVGTADEAGGSSDGRCVFGADSVRGRGSAQLMAELLGRNLHMTSPAAGGRGGAGGRGRARRIWRTGWRRNRIRRPARFPNHAGYVQRGRRSDAAVFGIRRWITKACPQHRFHWWRRAC